jgi:hypothetical protein
MGTSYDTDIVAWANEQAALLRAGRLDAIDVLNIAEEIEDVGRSEAREFGRRLCSLMANLLKWQYQTAWRCAYWREKIADKRCAVAYCLRRTPSLRNKFADDEWLEIVWNDAARLIRDETGLDFPERCPWSVAQLLNDDFFPD